MIQFENISLQFKDKILFENFNLTIKTGDKVLLKAPSGKGKSTLFKMLLGFQKPDKGAISLNDHLLSSKRLPYYRKNIGYVSQDVDLKQENVQVLIKQVLDYNCNKHIDYDEAKIKELLEYFGLQQEIMTKNVKQLSGGERQRLGLIICILLDRSIWLLDEVTAGLDKESKEKVVDFMMNEDRTIIIISHDELWAKQSGIIVKEW